MASHFETKPPHDPDTGEIAQQSIPAAFTGPDPALMDAADETQLGGGSCAAATDAGVAILPAALASGTPDPKLAALLAEARDNMTGGLRSFDVWVDHLNGPDHERIEPHLEALGAEAKRAGERQG